MRLIAIHRRSHAWAAAAALALAAPMAQAVVSLADIEAQFRRGETNQALARTEQALRDEPGHAALHFLNARLLVEAGRPAEAQQVLMAMTQSFPDLPEPFNNLAVLKAAQGQLDEARALLEAALLRDGGYRLAHENLGDLMLRLAARAYRAAGADRGDAALQRKLRLVEALTARPERPERP